ncbi:unnamed protein product [Bursaphelenchus okinawaensis]|uniref:Uncharacterized protein n=1 Tax=Bursaphelenchus okinawaensis TaxID=465554 RepID=A0A811L7Z4_9BILA|nr:unnamed protein product [Bursaphelenchus okinawaensis]CAG9118707.1 unnamed protein product [Bursaphelenchus okinawaensis]
MAHPIKFMKDLLIHSYVYHVAKPIDLHALAKTDWGAVTGCTHGIGRAYAEEMAKKGFNVLLIGRTPSKLEKTQTELSQEYPHLKFDVAEIDFTTSKQEDYEKAMKGKLEKVGFLVNNVGYVTNYPDTLLNQEYGLKDAWDTINVNIKGMVAMTYLGLQGMLPRNGGIIVNVTSAAGGMAFPYMAIYSMTKKAGVHFTSAMMREYPQIYFQNLVPGWVMTEMAKIREKRWHSVTTDEYAASAINTVGLIKETRGNWKNQLYFNLFFNGLPEEMAQKFWEKGMKEKKQENILYQQDLLNGIKNKLVK